MNYRNLFSCKGKVAVVTGGAGLIGKEIVKGLASSGATVYIADNNEAKAKKLLNLPKVKFVCLDITSEDSIVKTFEVVRKLSGKIDVLVNSAYPRTKDWGNKFEDVSFDSWKTNLDMQLGGYFLCCRQAAQYMKNQGGGSIINLGSTYGVTAPDFSIYEGTSMTMSAAYSAIKGGLIVFSKYLASYYGKYKVRVNVVSPGGIFDNQPESFVEKYSKRTIIGRMGKPSEIAGAVVFLASEAASYVTGHNLMVDGGWTAW
ncbi:MAG: oxidoreductase [Candidatus Omnitrophota bacterium]